MRLVPSSGSAGLGGLGPSLGAAASLLAAGVTLSLLVASLFGVRVWPSPSDRGEGGSLRLARPAAPSPRPAVRVSDAPVEVAVSTPVATAQARRVARRPRTPTRSVPAPRARVAPRTTTPASPVPTSAPAERRRSDPAPAPAAATPVPAETARPAPATPAPTGVPTQGPVEKTVATVRQTVVDPVVTALPSPVASPVAGVLDQVEATGKAVDGVLRGLQHKP